MHCIGLVAQRNRDSKSSNTGSVAVDIVDCWTPAVVFLTLHMTIVVPFKEGAE